MTDADDRETHLRLFVEEVSTNCNASEIRALTIYLLFTERERWEAERRVKACDWKRASRAARRQGTQPALSKDKVIRHVHTGINDAGVQGQPYATGELVHGVQGPSKDMSEDNPADRIVRHLGPASAGNVAPGATFGPLFDLIDAGCDLDMDIIPVVEAKVATLPRPLKSWGAPWLVAEIRAARDRRLRPGPGPSQQAG